MDKKYKNLIKIEYHIETDLDMGVFCGKLIDFIEQNGSICGGVAKLIEDDEDD